MEAVAKAEGLPKEGRKRRKGLQGADVAVRGVYSRHGGGLGDAVDWILSALTGAARPSYTNPTAARYGARSPLSVLRFLWPEPGSFRGV